MDRTPPTLAYTVPEVATGAKISEAKVWLEIADGELETCMVGDRRLITPEQAQRWLKRKADRAKAVREQRAKARTQPELVDD